MSAAKKTCFIVAPFGKKRFGRRIVNFDRLFSDSLFPLAESLGYQCLRSDLAADAGGSLHQRMFESIFQADLVIADLTTRNANVFYELGIRHALAPSMTIMIQQGTADGLPFDVGHFEVLPYELDATGILDRPSRRRLMDRISTAQRASSTNHRYTDSPVLKDLNLEVRLPIEEIQQAEVARYGLYDVDGQVIRIVNDELLNVKNVDLWVNSENNYLQMARPIEQSISATIRYSGAKVLRGKIIQDTIQNELTRKARGQTIHPGTVIVTGAGRLRTTNDVQAILHVVAAIGTPMKGFVPVADIADTAEKVLRAAEKECSSQRFESLLLPLLGTGQARGQLEKSAEEILRSVLSFLMRSKKTKLREISILAKGRRAFNFCQSFLDNDNRVKRLS